MIFKRVIPSNKPEEVPPILVSAGFQFIYIQTGESTAPIAIDPAQLTEIVNALYAANAARVKARTV